MKVHRLRAHNFRILGGSPIDLVFPTGRIGIFGPNEVGKSSLLDALEVALFGIGAGRKAAGAERGDMVTWGRDAADLSVEFSSGLERYRIRRHIGRRHEAELYQIVEDQETLMSSSVQEIQETVASIVGMDREAFEKLVYVRQKDLDALREVAKASREAMMNKVMGMEVFDEAITAAKVDLRAREGDAEVAASELSAAEEDWRLHSQRLTEREEHLLISKEIASKLVETQKREVDASRKVAALEWLKDENAKGDLRNELASKVADLTAQLEAFETKRRELFQMEVALNELGEPKATEDSLRRRLEAQARARQREVDARSLEEKYQRTEHESQTLGAQRVLVQEATHLLSLRVELDKQRNEFARERDQLKTLESEVATEERKAKLKAAEAQALRTGVAANKRRMLAVFAGTLLVGVALLVFGLLFLVPAILLGVALLLGAGWAFARFLRLERIGEASARLVALIEQRLSVQSRAEQAERRMADTLRRAGFGSLTEISERSEKLLRTLKASTGLDRPEAFDDALQHRESERDLAKAELDRVKGEVRQWEASARKEDLAYSIPPGADVEQLLMDARNQVSKKHELEAQRLAFKKDLRVAEAKDLPKALGSSSAHLRQVEAALTQLVANRPPEAEGRTYVEEEHRHAIAGFRLLQEEVNRLTGDQRAMEEALRRIEEDLARTKLGFENYPLVKQRSTQLSEEVRVLDRVTEEIRATGTELRAKVLPAARYILNQLLPVITDGRYTDLEISEDFQFQVHSSEAGGFKKRDVFSGGTQDQFLIALRLAFTQAILDSRVRADEYSLFLDECTASSDDIRKQGIFQVLDSMKATFSQIFIVAHEDISPFVDHHLALERGADGYTVVRARSWAD